MAVPRVAIGTFRAGTLSHMLFSSKRLLSSASLAVYSAPKPVALRSSTGGSLCTVLL